MIGQGSEVRIDTYPTLSPTRFVGSNQDDDNDSAEASGRKVPFATLSMESWIYRGEGNANLVIAIPHEQKVIRFRKLLRGEASPDGGRRRACRELEFVRDVVSSFLGSYVPNPEILRYTLRDVARLSEAIRSLRPEKRRHKDIAEEYATKFPDYAFLPAALLQDRTPLETSASTFCVEIKPKQGFVRAAERYLQKCPYCLTQFYKLKRKSIASRSTYCPLDLFSGDEGRMNTALEGLLRSPQNNFKIVKDGIVVYDQDSSSIDELQRIFAEWFRSLPAHRQEKDEIAFCTLVRETLLRSFPHDAHTPDPHHACSPRFSPNQDEEIPAFEFIASDTAAKARKLLHFTREECNFEGTELPSDSVLGRILNMQRLCGTNTESVYDIYSSYSMFLNDDLIYTELNNLQDMHGEMICCQTTPVSINDATELETLNAEYRHVHTCRKHTAYLEKSCRGDPNGNEIGNNVDLACVARNDTIIDSSIATPSLSVASEHCQLSKLNEKMNGERKRTVDGESTLINIKHLMALRNYLLFTTAKDCSILMAFHELKRDATATIPEEYVVEVSDGVRFLSSVRVSDVDPKNVHSIRKHIQRDIDILESVISTLEDQVAMANAAAQ